MLDEERASVLKHAGFVHLTGIKVGGIGQEPLPIHAPEAQWGTWAIFPASRHDPMYVMISTTEGEVWIAGAGAMIEVKDFLGVLYPNGEAKNAVWPVIGKIPVDQIFARFIDPYAGYDSLAATAITSDVTAAYAERWKIELRDKELIRRSAIQQQVDRRRRRREGPTDTPPPT